MTIRLKKKVLFLIPTVALLLMLISCQNESTRQLKQLSKPAVNEIENLLYNEGLVDSALLLAAINDSLTEPQNKLLQLEAKQMYAGMCIASGRTHLADSIMKAASSLKKSLSYLPDSLLAEWHILNMELCAFGRKGIKHFDSAEAAYKEFCLQKKWSKKLSWARAYGAKAFVHFTVNYNVDTARFYFKKADLQIAHQALLKDRFYRIRNLINEINTDEPGNIQEYISRLHEVDSIRKKSLPYNNTLAAALYTFIGSWSIRLYKPAEAFHYLTLANDYACKSRNSIAIHNSCLFLFQYHIDTQSPVDAKKWLDSMTANVQRNFKPNHAQTVRLYKCNASYCKLLGSVRQEIEWHKRTLEWFANYSDTLSFNLTDTYSMLAEAYGEIGNSDSSLYYAQLSTSISERVAGAESFDYAWGLPMLATAYSHKGKLEKALAILAEMKQFWKSQSNAFYGDLRLAYYHEANLLNNAGRYKEALETVKQGFAVFGFEGTKGDSLLLVPNELPPYMYLAELYEEKVKALWGLYKSSSSKASLEYLLQWCKAGVHYLHHFSMYKQDPFSASRKIGMGNTLYDISIHVCYELYQQLKQPQVVDDWLWFSDSKRAHLQRASLQLAQSPPSNLPLALRNKEADFSSQMAQMADSVLTQKKFNIFNASLKLHLDELKKQAYDYYLLKYKPFNVSVAAVQQKLNSNKYFVQYIATDSLVSALVVSKQHHYMVPLQNGTRLIQACLAWMDSVRHFREYKQIGILVRKMLWDPVAMLIPKGSEVTICSNGFISNLSFEGLPYDNDLFVVHDYEIFYSSSAFVFCLGKETNGGKNRALFMSPGFSNKIKDLYIKAVPIVDSNYLKLLQQPNMEKLAIEKASYFSTSAKGLEATERLFRTEAESSNLILVASHTFINNENPWQSVFYFSPPKRIKDQTDDAKLMLSEVLNLPLQADLVILAACESGRQTENKDASISNFSNAFLFAGAKQLVLTFWSVDETSTSKITTGFLKYFNDSTSPSKALCNAKRDYLQSMPISMRHPGYWSGIVLLGNNEKIRFSPAQNHLYIRQFLYAMFALLIGMQLLFVWKKYKKDRA